MKLSPEDIKQNITTAKEYLSNVFVELKQSDGIDGQSFNIFNNLFEALALLTTVVEDHCVRDRLDRTPPRIY